MNNKMFDDLVQETLSFLENDAKENPEQYTKSGEGFEPLVVQAVENAMGHLNINMEIKYKKGGHSFPDIILIAENGDKYGIEVKSSTAKGNSWKINGNSVMGSTSEAGIIRTVIIFGKLRFGDCLFRAKNYEDSIANVVVTHSPRYFIDLDLEKEDTFFYKSNISYEDLKISENPIEMITDYFRAQGHKAWWLAESTPAAIRQFSELSSNEQEELISYGFVHFPELFSKSSKKFTNMMSWLATEHSIVDSCLRDKYTAGGRVNIYASGNRYENLPQIFNKLHRMRKLVLNHLDNDDLEVIEQDWEIEVSSSFEERVDQWIELVSKQYPIEDLNNIDITKLLQDIIND